MCLRSRNARDPFETIWMKPCITMAVATGTMLASTPIRIRPPAIPKTPEIVAVTKVAARRKAMTANDIGGAVRGESGTADRMFPTGH
jgi:hypothetical protein